MGLNGKLLRVIRNMYQAVKSCVKLCGNYSDRLSIGLRQGEIISPIMFSLFVEDLEMYLQNGLDSGICLNDICLILLLFADDMVILSLTPDDLQLSLNNLSILSFNAWVLLSICTLNFFSSLSKALTVYCSVMLQCLYLYDLCFLLYNCDYPRNMVIQQLKAHTSKS